MAVNFGYYYPVVGVTGLFELGLPFGLLIPANKPFQCIMISSISKLNEMMDVKRLIYLENGLTENDYITALNNFIPIVLLRNEAGIELYVPANYILKYPSGDGVLYKKTSLIVNLPYIPVNLDLNIVRNILNNEIKAIYGFDVESILDNPTDIILTPYEEHNNITFTRNLAKSKTKSDKQQIAELSNLILTYQQKIAKLEEYVKNTL